MKIRAWQLFACVSLFSIFIMLSPYFGFGATILKILALTPLFFTICLAACIVDEYGSNQSLHIIVWGFAASIGLATLYLVSRILLPDFAIRVSNFLAAAGTAYGISAAATVAFEKFRKRLPSSGSTALIASAAALPGVFVKPSILLMSAMCALWLILMAIAMTRSAPVLVRRRLRTTA